MPFRIDLTLDCANPTRLAEFWKLALGYEDEPPPAPFATREEWLQQFDLADDDEDDGAWLRAAAGEGSFDEIGGDGVGSDPLPLPAAGGALQPGPAHQQPDLVVTDFDTLAHGQLGAIRSVSIACRIARSDGGRLRCS